MFGNAPSATRRYGVALGVLVVATLLRLWADPLLGGSGFSIMFAAVMVAAWYGGLGPSLVALSLSLAISIALFAPSPDEPPEPALKVWTGLAVFFFVGVGTALLSESMRAAQRRAEAMADEALRQSEKLRATLACMSDALIVTDRQGRLTMMNPAAEALAGRSAAEAQGRPLDEAFCVGDESTQGRLDAAVADALQTGDAGLGRSIPLALIAPDGGPRSIDGAAAPIRDAQGGVTGAVLILRDVTDPQRIEQALRESEQRFSRFMQHLPGLAWIKDAEGRYVFVNDAAEKIFGAPRTELYGKTDAEVFPAETAAQFEENDRRAVKSAAGELAVETLKHDDGVVHHSIVSKFPIPGPAGDAALIGGMAVDITDRIRAEEALLEADRRKDEFLATLAHELRNPLAPISNSLQWLRLQEDHSADSAAALAVIERQVRQMVRIVDDLLDVNRITRGRLELRKERIELAEVVRAAVETSRPAIDAQGHELVIALPEQPIYIEGDLVRLAQTFSNLLYNSAKYTEPGGHIRLEAEPQAGEAAISVRDNGIGIATDVLPQVFEMFRQGDRAQGRSQGGLGIGLSLVRRLVELHGGSVEARSEGPGQGSEFVVRLPLSESQNGAPMADRPEADRHAIPKAPQRRVLVVDDNKDSAATLGMMLEVMGSEVRMAHDGLEAIEAAEIFLPEFIFMDIGMPKLNGYDATRRIRNTPWGKGIVIVALTGWGQSDDARQSTEAGCTTHIVKPIDFAVLGKLMAS